MYCTIPSIATQYYGKNLQGDIIKIYDATGAPVVSYVYDAWGEIISITGSLASTVGQVNPFRYRGYYYDTETGFYYLNSRYYDPSVGRFLNADGIIGANGGILGYNMFAYCSNNPVMYSDPSGYEKVVILGTAQDVNRNGICDLFEDGDFFWYQGSKYYDDPTTIENEAILISGPDTYPRDSYDPGSRDTSCENIIDKIHNNKEPKLKNHVICFVAGTLVLTENGHAAIETIKAGDMVWAENPETGEKGLKRVVRTFVNETDRLIHVHAGSQEIKTTDEHPFWVVGQGWVSASNLKSGDILKLESGKTVAVEKIEFEQLNEPVKVFNFEVEDFHTYYVGESSILVHNTCGYEEKYNNDGSIKSRTWYTTYATISTHYDHAHAGVQPHTVVWSYNDQGFQGKTYWDMNGVQIK